MKVEPTKILPPPIKYRLQVIECIADGFTVGHVLWFDTWAELEAAVEKKRAPWVIMEISVVAPKQWVFPSARPEG